MVWILLGLMTLAASFLIAFPLLGKHEDGKHHLGGPILLAILLPLSAFALYLTAGSPSLPSAFYKSAEDKIAALEKKIALHPDNGAAWGELARLYGDARKIPEAKMAWSKAVSAAPRDLALHLDYANFLLSQQTGAILPPDFAALVAQIDVLAPTHPLTLFYKGLLAKASNDKTEAKRLWQQVLEKLPPDTPLRQTLEAEIRSLDE